TATTPYEAPKPKSNNEPDSLVNVHLYRSMIGSLMYLIASRPDIMFAVSACSRNQVTPTTSNLESVKKIFKYLKGQPKLGLWYPKESPFVLEAYSDSDYARANKDRKSITSGCQFLGRRLISWQCKKQTIVATSSTEAEYVTAANCYGQILIQVLKIHTDDNVADLLTKAFDGPRVINSPCYHNKELASPEQTATAEVVPMSVVGLSFPAASSTRLLMCLYEEIQICAEVSCVQVKTQADWMSLYVVPTGRVVVPTGRYVVPAGKVIIIVSPGRLNLVPTGRILNLGKVK
ncbi:hypothetical protein Tco_0009451, partial [Tanacetum coccineum]